MFDLAPLSDQDNIAELDSDLCWHYSLSFGITMIINKIIFGSQVANEKKAKIVSVDPSRYGELRWNK